MYIPPVYIYISLCVCISVCVCVCVHVHCCCLVATLRLVFCNPMDYSTPGSSVLTVSQSLLKFTSIESVMPSNYVILCHPLLLLPSVFPSMRVFSNESALCIRWSKIWSFNFNISHSNEHQDWSPLGWTGWITLKSKGLSRVFSNTSGQKHPFFGSQHALQSTSHIRTWLLEKSQPWLDGPLLAK